MLRPRLPRLGRNFISYRRSLHHVPTLTHGHDFTAGVEGLLSATGFNIAWTQYQGLMIRKLNEFTAGSQWESAPPKSILLNCARDPHRAALFNYASMASNNHFFFESLSPKTTDIPSSLKDELKRSFSSIETLRRELIITASSLFGPGFVWLVKHNETKIQEQSPRFSILATYLAGSPYPGAHHRKQTVDMNTEQEEPKTTTEHFRQIARGPVANTVGAHGALSKSQITPPGGIDITPCLCINTWDYVWLHDYRVARDGVSGKQLFAENWWYSIDWAVVADRANAKRGSQYLVH